MLNPAGAGELPTRKKLKNTNQESSSSSSSGIHKPFLPDDIIMDIVTYLPTKDALQFQLVCKTTKTLMSSPDFITSHNKRSAPMILVFNSRYIPRPCMLDRCWGYRNSKELKSLNIYPDYITKLSHDGLIVSKNRKNPGIFIIFNPVYSHVVRISVPVIQQKLLRCEIYGVFYQASIREYCTLWAFTVEPRKVQYKMLNLGGEPMWRDVTNPWTQNGRVEGIRPVLVNEYLYWVVLPDRDMNVHIPMNVDILEFDTRNEVFEVIPVPFAGYVFDLNLLQANGVLMLVKFSDMHSPLNIWTLGNRSNKIWTRMTVNANDVIDECFGHNAVAFWNDELLVSLMFQLYVCNLKLGTARRFGRDYRSDKTFAPHVMSLASLKNCKSDICMVEEGNKNPAN